MVHVTYHFFIYFLTLNMINAYFQSSVHVLDNPAVFFFNLSTPSTKVYFPKRLPNHCTFDCLHVRCTCKCRSFVFKHTQKIIIKEKKQRILLTKPLQLTIVFIFSCVQVYKSEYIFIYVASVKGIIHFFEIKDYQI